MHSVLEAQAIMDNSLPPFQEELIGLGESVGRMLAQTVKADRDGPPFDRVCMDGIAIDSRELASGQRLFKIQGLQLAGQPPLERSGQFTAVEVATGAVMPINCDQVIRYEDLQRQVDTATIHPSVPAQSGKNVQPRGAAYQAQDILLEPGCLLSSPHLHALASAGLHEVRVRRRLNWALISTGDELVEVRAFPQDWQIRRSNDASIAAEARCWGLIPSDYAWLPDQEAALGDGLAKLLKKVEVLVLTGGVSHGVVDLVPQVLQQLGAVPAISGIRQKPGKPFWFGRFPDGKVAIGLPGNPVSSLFSFRRLVLPWLLRAEGRQPASSLQMVTDLPRPSPDQTMFVPVTKNSRGDLQAIPYFGSGDYRQLIPSTGFVELAPTADPETALPYYAWGSLGASL